MLVKDMMEVINEDRAEENLSRYWAWIYHNFIHRINSYRQMRCVATVNGVKCPAVTYGSFCPPAVRTLYMIASPKRYPDLRDFCEGRPDKVVLSRTLNGITRVDENEIRQLLGHPSEFTGVPCGSWLILNARPLTIDPVVQKYNQGLSNLGLPEQNVRLVISRGLNRVPAYEEGFDNEAFERYLAGEPDPKRERLGYWNSAYFCRDIDRYLEVPGAQTKYKNPIFSSTYGYTDDDVRSLIEEI